MGGHITNIGTSGRVRRIRRRAVAAVMLSVVGAAALATLTGCTSVSCPSWVALDTPAEAAHVADAVVVRHVDHRVGTTHMFGATANIWSVTVTRWIKGSGDARIQVISPPAQCGPTNDPYFGEDPFEAAQGEPSSVMFLTDTGDAMSGLSPLQGITTATGEDIPSAWPTSSP